MGHSIALGLESAFHLCFDAKKVQVPYSSRSLYRQTRFYTFFKERNFIIPFPVKNLQMHNLSSAQSLGLISLRQPLRKPIVYTRNHLNETAPNCRVYHQIHGECCLSHLAFGL